MSALEGITTTMSGDTTVIFPAATEWYATAEALFADGWNVCVDITAVDYSTYAAPRNLPEGVEAGRFEVVANFLSHERRARLRARTQLSADEPTIDSLVMIYPGVDALEREIYDMFGITFTGHPDLSRILMPEDWVGHPLRKDAAVGSIPVQFKAPSAAQR